MAEDAKREETETTTPPAPSGREQGEGSGAETAESREAKAAYEALRGEVRALLEEAQERLSPEQMRRAVDEGARRLREAGRFTAETLGRAAETVRKDLLSAARELRPGVERLTDTAGGLLETLRDRGGHLAALAARALGEWAQELGDRLDAALAYHTGEVAHAGTFVCTRCGETIRLERTGRLPPCPRCHHTTFRRR